MGKFSSIAVATALAASSATALAPLALHTTACAYTATTLHAEESSAFDKSDTDLDTFEEDIMRSAGLDKKKKELMEEYLADAASKNTILNGDINRDYEDTTVLSTPLMKMLEAYMVTDGGIYVVCAPQNIGKTTAADFLIHGDHPYRPSRALKISAASYKNFPVDFSVNVLETKHNGSTLGPALCGALVPEKNEPEQQMAHRRNASKDKNDTAKKKSKQVGNVASKKTTESLGPTRTLSLDEQPLLKLIGEEKNKLPIWSEKYLAAFRRNNRPVLIIDDFNKRTDENVAFVESLLQDASKMHIFVLLLTTSREFASELVDLNGPIEYGRSKIKPLFGNIDNKDYKEYGTFKGKPRWNDLPWSLQSLQDLVPPLCAKRGVEVNEVLPAMKSLSRRSRWLRRLPFVGNKEPPTPQEVIDEALSVIKIISSETSPEFLKRKLEDLKKGISQADKDLTNAKQRLEEGKAEWGSQIDILEAEYATMQNRMNSKISQKDSRSTVEVVREMLNVLDNYDRAFASITAETEEEKLIEQEYHDMYTAILETFTKLGVEEIETLGVEFDYEVHQALFQKPSEDYEEGLVCEEFAKGFKLKDTLIRPAMVAVAV